ncbi:ABC transporter permease subunit [Microlunatus panaciterrae]|uniref:ABC-type spermidine/putrescine transport system permease subunit I n=1 Tax=Microlunatus panaciterrae TaxID=400768 RepID=A0ABS2RLQ6_9ACTN|nr:ABC transporter permease subunit [Microlunatus panaciterrae]MBM7799945.1 ABC-type spermidine/putrescine transport system permease subunit I [Microlunatus panaciterrae]
MKKRPLVGLLMASPPLLLVAVFVGFPIVVAVAYSLGHVGGLNQTIATIAREQHEVDHWWQMTAGAYRDVFADERFRRDLTTTVVITLISTATVVVLAWVIALYLRVSQSWAAKALSALAVVPMFIPVVIASWAILTFYAGDGLIRSVAAKFGVEAPTWGYSVTCIIIGLVWTHLPFATLMIVSGVQSVPDSLIEAASDAGASFFRTVRSVIAPMAMVPTVIAGTFTAIGTLGSFTVPYFTGPNAPNMLGVDMASYFQAFNRPQQSVVMAVVVFVIAAGFGAIYVWANFRSAQESGRV